MNDIRTQARTRIFILYANIGIVHRRPGWHEFESLNMISLGNEIERIGSQHHCRQLEENSQKEFE